MIIYIDMDDTIADCAGYWIKEINRELHLNIVKKDILTFGIPGLADILPKVYMEPILEIIRRRGFFLGLDPLPGAQEVISELLRWSWKYDVYFTTAMLPKSYYTHQEKCMWLQEYFHVGEERIIFTHQKHLLRGDVMIDDKLENLKDFKGYRIVFDQPWNRCYNGVKPFVAWRCMNWEEVSKMIGYL